MDAAGVPYERLDAGEIMRRWPQWRLGRRHPRTLPGGERHRDGRPGQRGPPAAWREPMVRPCWIARRSTASVRSAASSRCWPAVGPTAAGRLVIAAGALEQPGARCRSACISRFGHPGAGHLLRFAPGGRFRGRSASRLDLDGRPLLLRFPHVRRGGAQGGPGRRRGGDTARTPAPSSPTPPRSSGSSGFSSAVSPRRWAR